MCVLYNASVHRAACGHTKRTGPLMACTYISAGLYYLIELLWHHCKTIGSPQPITTPSIRFAKAPARTLPTVGETYTVAFSERGRRSVSASAQVRISVRFCNETLLCYLAMRHDACLCRVVGWHLAA